MYEELVKELRDSAEWADRLAILMGRTDGDTHAPIMRKAADAIEELSRLHEAQRQNLITLMNEDPEMEWIPVTERLPETDGLYLVSVKNDHKRRYSKTAWYEKQSWFARQDVTHWMPLPEPYKGEK